MGPALAAVIVPRVANAELTVRRPETADADSCASDASAAVPDPDPDPYPYPDPDPYPYPDPDPAPPNADGTSGMDMFENIFLSCFPFPVFGLPHKV
jgi:hypothetical protein